MTLISSSTPPLRGRPPQALVVNDSTLEEARLPVDWSSWYLTEEDDEGQGTEQAAIIDTVLSCLGQLALERDWQNVLWSGDQFFAWIESEPNVRVSPDVYLLDEPPPPPRPKMWQTWLPGHRAPRFALEVASENWRKDYELNPPKYAQLGTEELVIYDPEAAGDERVLLQLYRRQADGVFAKLDGGAGPLFSEELGVFLFHRLEDGAPRLRLARDAECRRLVPTAAERAQSEAERAQSEAERAEAERRRADNAEARVRELEERLRRLGE